MDNQGRIIADAGSILLQAQNVNQSGLIQANSVREHNGTIELFASKDIQLASTSVIQANGDGSGASQGGNIVIKSGDKLSDNAGSSISAAGGANGGNGGSIDISAPNMGGLLSDMQAAAVAGSQSGRLVIDPANIVLGSSGSGSAGSGTVTVGTGSGTLNLNVNSAFAGFSQITLQASQNITLSSSWNLATSTGKDAAGCQLTLEAGNNISFSSGSVLDGGNNWALSLTAGANFAGQGAVSGTGNLTLSGASTIQTGAGNINILAGGAVTVGTGAIRTIGGGSISVQTLAGSVNCGSNPSGFIFGTTGVGYSPSPQLGGISTAAGGNVSINSG